MTQTAISPTERPAGRLDCVEAGRGLAALAVVIFHANASSRYFGAPQWTWPTLLEHGVDFFFVLSGFVIMHAHSRDVGHREHLADYALKRAIRLLPTLWIVVGGWALLRWAVGAEVDLQVLLGSLLPYPSLAPTMPPVVWTLRHELVFYVLFSVLLASRRLGLTVFAIWAGLICVQLFAVMIDRPVTGLSAFFISGYAAEFMLGMAVSVIHRRLPAGPSCVPLLWGLVLLGAIMVLLDQAGLSRSSLADYHSPGATWGALGLGVGFAAILYGLVRLDRRVTVPAPLLALGASSYALYLVHTPANSFVQIIARELPPWVKAIGGGLVLLTLAGVVLGWLLHRSCERPIISWLRRVTRLTPSKGMPRPCSSDSLSTAPSHLR